MGPVLPLRTALAVAAVRLTRDSPRRVLVVTGGLGALATMSTFALEATDGPRSRSAVIIATTIAGGLVAVALGHAVA